MVRIIAGSRRGMRLRVPKGFKTRPTADRTKESIFNMLGARVMDATVLDLFAGSGALGLEALSRGAARSVFVDWDQKSLETIRANIEKTNFTDQAAVIRAHLPNLSPVHDYPGREENKPFDLIFLDPPYERGLIASTLTALDKAKLVAARATIVVEHSSLEELPTGLKNLKPFREKRFGQAHITFLKWD